MRSINMVTNNLCRICGNSCDSYSYDKYDIFQLQHGHFPMLGILGFYITFTNHVYRSCNYDNIKLYYFSMKKLQLSSCTYICIQMAYSLLIDVSFSYRVRYQKVMQRRKWYNKWDLERDRLFLSVQNAVPLSLTGRIIALCVKGELIGLNLYACRTIKQYNELHSFLHDEF